MSENVAQIKNNAPSEIDVYRLFDGLFKKIYGDLVAVTATKPTQVIFEIEAAFSHIVVANLYPDQRDQNIGKAIGHIQRATFDSAKILWLEYKQRLDNVASDSDIRKFCVNCPESDFVKKYYEAEELAREARRMELDGVGRDPSRALEKYFDAAQAFKEAHALIDRDKLNSFRRFSLHYNFRKHIVGFASGPPVSG